MHDNDKHEARHSSRSWRSLVLAAFLLAPLAGCEIPDFEISIDEDALDAAAGDVQVNVSGAETSVGACVSRGFLGPLFGPCKGADDSFSFQDGEGVWRSAPETIATLPAGTPVAVFWRSPEGQAAFEVVPAVVAITAPQADAAYRTGDTLTLRWSDDGSDEITIENQGACTGADPTDWRRVLAHDDSTPGQLTIRVADLIEAVRPFERCDITLRVTASRQGTFSSALEHVSGTITANTSAEVAIQVLP